MDPNNDIILKYKNISNKIKKRFLKKPNIHEGAEQFNVAAKELKNQECLEYSAFFSLAQARCENGTVNFPGEAEALLDAAHSFLQAQFFESGLGCPSFNENLTAATNCFDHAIRVYIENNQHCLAGSLCIELADSLKKLGLHDEAIKHYDNAIELCSGNVIVIMNCMRDKATCYLEIGNYEQVLEIMTELTHFIQKYSTPSNSGNIIGKPRDILVECEISRLLLIMLVKPIQQKLDVANKNLLTLYSWLSEDEVRETYLCFNDFLLLQSAFFACQSEDIEILYNLEKDLWPIFNVNQKQLFHLILKSL